MAKAKVILFKESGKYYTEEEWEIPTEIHERVPDSNVVRIRRAIGPYDMKHSKDFRRIGKGAVLVSEEVWGYPHLFPNEL